jgi:hypothetical protein
VTVTNTGLAPVAVTVSAIAGTSASQFTQTANTCPAVLSNVAGSNTCSVSVTFTPASTGNKTAWFTVTPSSGQVRTVSLTGTGTLAVGFTWPNFGTVGAWGNSASTRTITVTNNGGTPLTLDGTTPVAVASTSIPAEFSLVSTTCSSNLVLNASQSCTVTIQRVRPTPGAATGTLTIKDTGAATPTQVLNLSGT